MSYKIPLFDINYDLEEEKAVLKTIQSKWISMGPNIERLEKRFSAFVNVKHAVSLASCTAALHLALKILGVGKGDEVIVPSLTFVATVNAVRYVNAVPVFSDISSLKNLSISPVDIERKITSKTKAIIVMHYGGFACDMSSIMRIARKYNIYVIEDAAHSPGSEYNGKKLGTIGDIGCFSFFSNKNINCGEGGMLTTGDDEIAERAKLLRSHGMTSLSYDRARGHATQYDVLELGYNYRIDDMRGALALAQLKKLNSDLKRRKELRKCYIHELDGTGRIVIPYKKHKFFSSNYIFPVVLKKGDAGKREKIREELAARGIQTSVHYPAVHRFSFYRKFRTKLPLTEYISDCEITLPLYRNLKKNQIKYITKQFKNILERIEE